MVVASRGLRPVPVVAGVGAGAGGAEAVALGWVVWAEAIARVAPNVRRVSAWALIVMRRRV